MAIVAYVNHVTQMVFSTSLKQKRSHKCTPSLIYISNFNDFFLFLVVSSFNLINEPVLLLSFGSS